MEFKIDHDLHCHTSLSVCCGREEMNPDNILEHTKNFGYDTICFTNHYWDEKVPSSVPLNNFYAVQDTEHLRELLPLPKRDSMRVLFGCETEMNYNFELGISPEHYDMFDFIIIPPNHMQIKGFARSLDCRELDDIREFYLRRLEAITKLDLPFEKVGIAHMTVKLTFLRNIAERYKIFDGMDEKRLRDIFSFFAANGSGIELNAKCFPDDDTEHFDSYMRIYSIAKDCGCRFYCGSDAHALSHLDDMKKACEKAVRALNLTEKDRYIVPCR